MRLAIVLVLLVLAFSNGKPVKPEADSLEEIVKDTKVYLSIFEKYLEDYVKSYKERLANPDELTKIDIEVLGTVVGLFEEVDAETKKAEKDVDVALKKGKDGLLDFFEKGIKELKKVEGKLNELKNKEGLLEKFAKRIGWNVNSVVLLENNVEEMIKKLNQMLSSDEQEVVKDIIEDVVKNTKEYLDVVEKKLKDYVVMFEELLEDPDHLKEIDIKVIKSLIAIFQEVDVEVKKAEKEVDVVAKKGKKELKEFFEKNIKKIKDLEKEFNELKNTKGLSEWLSKTIDNLVVISKQTESHAEEMIRKLNENQNEFDMNQFEIKTKIEAKPFDDVVKDVKEYAEHVEKSLQNYVKMYKELLEDPEHLSNIDKQVIITLIDIFKIENEEFKKAEKEVELAGNQGKEALKRFFEQSIQKLKDVEIDFDLLMKKEGLSKWLSETIYYLIVMVQQTESYAEEMIKKLDS